jgi:HEPN domain-containing protein
MRQEVEIWWKQSEKDLDSAEKNFKIEEYHLVVFLCQQAIEKGLKAYYIKKKQTSPGTVHSLIYLATETKVPAKFYKFFRSLMPQFVNTRYPDAAYGVPSELYDKEIALEFLEKTTEVMQWLKKEIEQ